jgi:simple sugar transport system permease protein
MALAGTEVTGPRRRTTIAWRVAGAFIRRREASILVIGIGLFIYFSLANAAFYSGDDIKNIAESLAPFALICAGEVMLLICGEIDLSVGHVFALAPIIMYLTSSTGSTEVPGAVVAGAGFPIWVGVIFGLLASAGVGFVNGFITTFLRVPSFITTLGMLFFLNGINLNALSGQQVVVPFGNTFKNIMGGYPLYLNSEFYWAVALVLVVQGILSWTRWGLHTVATGGNQLGAAESGVNVRLIKIGNFMLASTLAGFAGILDSERVNSILPLQGGSSHMFFAVAGAVIGGTSLLGGVGTVIGGFLGVTVLIILQVGFNIIGVSAFNFDLITGLAILVSMILNVQVARLKNLGRLQ